MATCCHHKIDLKTFVNLKFFKDSGFSESEIRLLPRISKWSLDHGTRKDTAILGLKIRNIIDYARMMYIEEKLPHLKCGAFQYCDPYTDSFENILLIAYDPSIVNYQNEEEDPDGPKE